MGNFQIFDLELSAGRVGICQMPGRNDLASDLKAIHHWQADMVLTMTTQRELEVVGAGDIGARLGKVDIEWRHLPIKDFGAPDDDISKAWKTVAFDAHKIVMNGGRVLAHCWGGCGRSGMALLRLMIEAGEDPERALKRLRAIRPCAVETEAQRDWAGNINL